MLRSAETLDPEMLLLLKLFLVPLLIAGVTLASRRWGPRIAGLLTGLPMIAGPTLIFYAVERGNTFAANAAQATLLGLVGLGAFCVAYAIMATRTTWPLSLIVGWLAFGVVSGLLYRTQFGLVPNLVLAVAALLISRRFLPSPPATGAAAGDSKWDLPLRMLTAAALVVVLTAVADRLGPALSGALAPFPLATAIIAGFSHAQRGAPAVVSFFRGVLPGLSSFAIFCFVLAVTLRTSSLVVAVACALAAQLTVHGLMLWRITAGPSLPEPTPLHAGAELDAPGRG